MAIHWQIPFKSLRSGTDYTVNVYQSGYSGNAIVLKGGAEPFSTQEDDSDDMFTPIRTHSGYLRIVDDGFAANGTTAFDWLSFLPSTDTDRPVTLTDGQGNVVWQGFLQAQNFGGTLYGNPQVREFPVQSPLAILEGYDINYQNTEIRNFAYLLQYIISQIPELTFSRIIIQGGADAQEWLLKCIDWQNFCNLSADGEVEPRYNLYQCLEDMCRFWGWTARTSGRNLYLVCPDDSGESNFLTLTPAQLETMAGGTAAGTVTSGFSPVTGSVEFCNTNNEDFLQRGPGKATVTADGNAADDTVIGFPDEKVTKEMEDLGWQSWITGGDDAYRFTVDMTAISRPLLIGSAVQGAASFNLMEIYSASDDYKGVIRIKKTYSSGTVYASFTTVYEHAFADGWIKIYGNVYRQGKIFESRSLDSSPVGNKTMRLRLGIGKTRAAAQWFNGRTWSSTVADFKVSIGNSDNQFRISPSSETTISYMDHIDADGNIGLIFIEFLGSDDLDEISGERSFEIDDFYLECTSSNLVHIPSDSQWGGNWWTKIERSDRRQYVAKSPDHVRMDWNADCIYASDNDMNRGYGLIINPDGTYMGGASYDGVVQYPEQHLADRVTAYWALSKRRLQLELRSDLLGTVSPDQTMTVDGTYLYPIAVGHEWRDDITRLTLLQLL